MCRSWQLNFFNLWGSIIAIEIIYHKQNYSKYKYNVVYSSYFRWLFKRIQKVEIWPKPLILALIFLPLPLILQITSISAHDLLVYSFCICYPFISALDISLFYKIEFFHWLLLEHLNQTFLLQFLSFTEEVGTQRESHTKQVYSSLFLLDLHSLSLSLSLSNTHTHTHTHTHNVPHVVPQREIKII